MTTSILPRKLVFAHEWPAPICVFPDCGSASLAGGCPTLIAESCGSGLVWALSAYLGFWTSFLVWDDVLEIFGRSRRGPREGLNETLADPTDLRASVVEQFVALCKDGACSRVGMWSWTGYLMIRVFGRLCVFTISFCFLPRARELCTELGVAQSEVLPSPNSINSGSCLFWLLIGAYPRRDFPGDKELGQAGHGAQTGPVLSCGVDMERLFHGLALTRNAPN